MPYKDKEKASKYLEEHDKEKRKKRSMPTQRKYDLKKRYGLTINDVRNMYNDQCGHCLLCENVLEDYEGKGRDTHIDHCHEFGHVRGLLCRGCNLVIGRIEKVNIDIENRIEYIRRIHEYLIHHYERGNNNTAGDRDEMPDLSGASEEGA
jgi:hypothetical protein